MAPAPAEQIGESTAGEAHRSVPTPFLTKTYQLVDDDSIDDVISWNEDGSTFIVWRPAEFARDMLPKCFKHNNFSSFVRQLNTYGFRKIVPDRWEFANDCFRRGEKGLLRDINRRKISPAAATITVTTAAIPAARAVSPTNSGEEQVLSSNSSPSTVPSTVCRDSSCSSTAELLDENERLRKENKHLSHELTKMKKLCDNIFDLMSKYTNTRKENVDFPDKLLDLLPAKGCSDEFDADAGAVGQSRSKTDEDLTPRLFGVSIGVKRARGSDGEEREQQEEGPEVKSEPLDPMDTDQQDPPWLKYCHRSKERRVCN
ncbi:hypothetical protein HHK36_028885 [Tetracentron sinense]|uniref:HSF-type DNA-binding domain-containing protein n=1 Tax=Tetracentron sinense TaxID=13715 RepID=A0A834YH13_TETSI|nr:hypothetical protein HHK36_028885 [Tetracentron sinense]